MYLQGATINSESILTEWNGKKGKFLRTFGISNKRNKNEWRAPWAGILEHIDTAIGQPGIEYEKCVENKCGLDHVEADTFEETNEKQKPFKVSETIDYVINEDKKQVDVIDEVFDDDFWEKVKQGKIKYVSPMIWPTNGGYDIIGVGRDNIPQVDAYHWKWVHKAYLEENPAFGPEANISAMCEGNDCQVKLLSGKEVKAQLFAETSIANSDNLSHLQEIPLLYKHKGKLHFVSASSCVQDIIKKKKADGIEIDDQALAIAYSECGESANLKSSFKTCTCDERHKMSEQLQATLKATQEEKEKLEAKLKALTDEENKDAKYKSKLAKYASIFKGMEEKDREEMIAKFKAAQTDDENDKAELKAMEENHDEMKSKKATTDDPEKEELQATLKAMQASQIPGMISGLVAVKRSTGASKEELTNYHESLKAKSFVNLQQDYSENEITITRLSAKSTKPDSYGFDDSELSENGLAAKTLSDTFGDED